jgi:hypothetical protein
VTWRLMAAEKEGNQLKAVIGTDYSKHREERHFDQIVVNHGTLPLDDLYFELKPQSLNKGEMDQASLIEGKPQPWAGDGFELYRIGDAVAGRNTHAAIYEALRLMTEV